VENAQQDPQRPWSLTAVTAPCFLQSTSFGNSTLAGEINVAPTDCFLAFTDLLKPFKVVTNSWCNYKRNMRFMKNCSFFNTDNLLLKTYHISIFVHSQFIRNFFHLIFAIVFSNLALVIQKDFHSISLLNLRLVDFFMVRLKTINIINIYFIFQPFKWLILLTFNNLNIIDTWEFLCDHAFFVLLTNIGSDYVCYRMSYTNRFTIFKSNL